MESFFSSLKNERICKRIYKTRDMARADVFDYIEVFCSRSHRHSHLGESALRRSSVRLGIVYCSGGAVHRRVEWLHLFTYQA